jgi:4-aminobutyrate aminotransferase
MVNEGAGPGTGDLAAEGDVNLSPLRRAWETAHVGPVTRALLDRDRAVFLHQSLSTPCFNALAAAEGIWLTDVEGRRCMDFHGNNVHQLGHGHPRVLAAMREALSTLPFSPRRYTNESRWRNGWWRSLPTRWARCCSPRAGRWPSAWR